jgi:hypothetical protein
MCVVNSLSPHAIMFLADVTKEKNSLQRVVSHIQEIGASGDTMRDTRFSGYVALLSTSPSTEYFNIEPLLFTFD